MMSKYFLVLAIFLVSSAIADKKLQHEAKHTLLKANYMKTMADKEVNTNFGGACAACHGGGQGIGDQSGGQGGGQGVGQGGGGGGGGGGGQVVGQGGGGQGVGQGGGDPNVGQGGAGGQGGKGQGGGDQSGGQGGQQGSSGQGGQLGGGGGQGDNGKGWSAGWSHGGIYGSGNCLFGCCSKSFGSSIKGGYVACKCCLNAAEAKAYKDLTQSLPTTTN